MTPGRQTVALLQLTPEEGDTYRDCPVYLNFHTGFYMFPVSAHSHESLLASGEADAPTLMVMLTPTPTLLLLAPLSRITRTS